ncbi:MAG: threonylcarbamoyl-AMP synthase [Nitrospirae bacterium]|nr:threonylcarbamoyl-AMP synthase [Nitrospirota bacterium]
MKASVLELMMIVLSLSEEALDDIITKASGVLNSGGIVVYPTESFYALGVFADCEQALKNLYELKGRPVDKPLPLIVGDMEILLSVVKNIPDSARGLMERFWPGPLTLVFEAKESVSNLLTAGTGKVAVRVPGDSTALYLARRLGGPVTATSANPSAKPPAETAGEVVRYFGESVDMIIDAGRTPGGKPSTIVDVTVVPLRILREGRVSLHTSRV